VSHATSQSSRASLRPPPSLHLGSCRASSSDSGKKDSRAARVTQKASSDMSFCISPLPDCRGPEARTHMDHSGFGPLRLSSSAMFALRTRATHDRHRAVVWFQKRGVVPKEGQRGDQLAMQVEDASRDRTRFLSVRPGLRVTQIVFHYCNEGAAQVIVRSGCLRDGPG
jgi:hypothetical protein